MFTRGDGVKDDGVVVLREGFSWSAFWFGPFWLAARRAWLGVALYVGFLMLLLALRRWLGLAAFGTDLLLLLAALLTGFEASSLRARSLNRRGFELADVALGRDGAEAQRAFLQRRVAPLEDRRPAAPPPPAGPRRIADIGLFPDAGR